jgi:hypothetical protein
MVGAGLKEVSIRLVVIKVPQQCLQLTTAFVRAAIRSNL